MLIAEVRNLRVGYGSEQLNKLAPNFVYSPSIKPSYERFNGGG